MKTRMFVTGLALFMSLQVLHAQTMTDDQVISYAKQRSTAGTDGKTIAKELLASGATQDQLQRLAANRKNGISLTTPSAAQTTAIDRNRTNNGEDVPENTAGSGRKIFGHDVFRSKLLSFEPNMSLAISPTYVLGPGDEVIVDVYGASQSNTKLTIAPDGSVTVPRIGPIGVSGMTVEQAQARIQSAMGGHYKNSSIKVSVGQTRTISINVMGEVNTPGTYTLSAFATVFHALYMAGGINDVGTLRDVKVVRNGRIISTIDVYDYILTGRLAGDVKLRDNDVIIVGSYNNLVQISGKVKRPMCYEMKKGETVKTLIGFANGFTGDAYSKTVRVNRRAGEKLSVYNVDEFDFGSFTLLDEDSVSVGENEQRYENLVNVNGAVKRPGEYSLSSVNTVRGLIEAAGGLQEDAQKRHAVITRYNDDRTRKTVTVDLAGIMEGSVSDVILKNEDVLQIGSLASINDDRNMTIAGEVYNPGTFDYAENTSVEDLIIMAGGLKESASLLNVEVARRIINPEAATDSIIRSEVFNLQLNDTAAANYAENFILKPYDKVSIRRSPVFVDQQTVTVSGEVVFAGHYTLQNNNVRLSDVIKQAGGLKNNASARNARLVRQMASDEIVRAKQLLDLAEQNEEDSIDIDRQNNFGPYSVGISLEDALAHPGSSSDILLRDGDEITVPAITNTVKISGEVLFPNNVTYEDGMKAKYYINEAGGYSKTANHRLAYIVYANGQVSRLSKGTIQPGCEIVVPKKIKKEHDSTSAIKWATLGTSITTAAALIVNMFK